MSYSPSQLTGNTQSLLKEIQQRLLHQDIIDDFLALQKAASESGFRLEIASSYRSFERQLAIWNGKFNGERPLLDSNSQPLDASSLSEEQKVMAILQWSALPGASRHHWGTDMDVYARNSLPPDTPLQLEPWEYDSGHQKVFSQWLFEHAEQYGFFFPYREDLGGVAREPWHISHMQTSRNMFDAFSLEILHGVLNNADILGKATVLDKLDWIYSTYVANFCKAESWNS